MDTFGSLVYLITAYAVVIIAIAIVYLISWMRIFRKAGKPQWPVIIPIYNIYVLLQIVRKPSWWVIFFILPLLDMFVNLPSLVAVILNIAVSVVFILILIGLAKAFGRSGWFAAGLLFLGVIFFPILGFGKSQYLGNSSPSVRQTV